MKVWLLQEGEMLPIISGARKMRGQLLAEALMQRDCDITWFSSTELHFSKCNLFNDNKIIHLNNQLRMIMFYCGGYKKTISLARLKHHRKLAQEFKNFIKDEEKPDLIIVTYPTIEFAYQGVKYAKKHNIPIVVDILDMWPDSFKNYFSFPANLMVGAVSIYYNFYLKFILKNSNAVVSCTEDILSWAKFKVNKKEVLSEIVYLSAEEAHKPRLVKPRGKIICTFVGSFSLSYELETVVKAAKICLDNKLKFEFYFIGDGIEFNNIKELSKNLPNVKLTGSLDYEELSKILSITDIGIIPVNNISIPNKFFDYLSFGIPILSSAEGEIKSTLEENHLGFYYEFDDANALFHHLLNLQDRYLRRKLRQNCKKLYQKKFHPEIQYQKYLSVIDKVCAAA